MDVDALAARIRREAAGSSASHDERDGDASLEALLVVAEARLRRRPRWYVRGPLRAIVLRVTRERREAERAFVAALRACIAEQRALARRIAALEARRPTPP